MSSLVNVLNAILNYMFGLVMQPLLNLSPWFSLLCISVIAGVLLLWVYGKISNQSKIKEAKQKIYGNMLESVLFRHDLKLSLLAQGKMFCHGSNYLMAAVVPVLMMLLPVLLLLAQLNLWYAARPLTIGERGIIKVKLASGDPYKIRLEVPEGLAITPPLRIVESTEVIWSFKAQKLGDFTVRIADALGNNIEKQLKVGTGLMAVDAVWESGWWSGLLYPGTPAQLGFIESVSVSYPEREYSLLGMNMSWIVFFFLVSLLSGIFASRFMGVEI